MIFKSFFVLVFFNFKVSLQGEMSFFYFYRLKLFLLYKTKLIISFYRRRQENFLSRKRKCIWLPTAKLIPFAFFKVFLVNLS